MSVVTEPEPVSVKKKESYIDRPLSQNERYIIMNTSVINGIEFFPWFDSDANDFDSSQPFQDPYDYELPNKLREKGCYFSDPVSAFGNISIINWPLNPFCIRQVWLLGVIDI